MGGEGWSGQKNRMGRSEGMCEEGTGGRREKSKRMEGNRIGRRRKRGEEEQEEKEGAVEAKEQGKWKGAERRREGERRRVEKGQ